MTSWRVSRVDRGFTEELLNSSPALMCAGYACLLDILPPCARDRMPASSSFSNLIVGQRLVESSSSSFSSPAVQREQRHASALRPLTLR